MCDDGWKQGRTETDVDWAYGWMHVGCVHGWVVAEWMDGCWMEKDGDDGGVLHGCWMAEGLLLQHYSECLAQLDRNACLIL